MAKEAATASWRADLKTPKAAPWTTFTQTSELDADKEYYCVATWGILSITAAPAFMSNSPGNASLAALPPGQCVGVSMSARMVWPLKFVAETLTVWHDRKYSTAYFRSEPHSKAMQALRGRVEFRARRVWVKPKDIPAPGDADGTRDFWARVKRGEYRAVGAN